MTLHQLKIIETLKRGWHTQMDIALKGISLNLSKRLCEIEPMLHGWKVERRWQATPRCKQYRVVRDKK